MAHTQPNPLAAPDHRPYAIPDRPWAMRMVWEDLLFMHWALPSEALAPLIPEPLVLDTFDGAAWLGVVPFRMVDTRPRFAPGALALAFPELNVRTYVTLDGRPGVFFFSLDAASRLAVRAARLGFHLPYFDARMRCRREGDTVHYQSQRTHRGTAPATFRARYRPTGDVFHAPIGSLEMFLTDRYCLYSPRHLGSRGPLPILRGEIHHAPWPLQPAACEIGTLDMTRLLNLPLPPLDQAPPHLLFARRLEVIAWRPVQAA